MAENAAKSGAIGRGVGLGSELGTGDDQPPRRNMNGNRSARFGSDGKKGPNSHKKSVDSPLADEEAKLLQQKQQQQQKVPQVVKGLGITTDIGGDGEGIESGGTHLDGENGDLRGQTVPTGVSVIDMIDSGSQSRKPSEGKGKNVFKAAYNRLLTSFEVSKKSERPLISLILLSLLLLVALILLVIFWPRLPGYLTREVCLEAECLEASKQLLSWAKPEANTCRSPYEWACGRFEEKYSTHSFFEVNKGEWNFDAYQDYEDTSAAYEFISKLPTVAMSYSTQSMIKKLHSICTTVETVSNSEAITSLKRALMHLGGWRMLLGNNNPHWGLRENLQKVQPRYGATPFFKLGIDSRNAPPYDYIITVSEGTLGLPSKEFYTLEERHPIIQAYHTYLRDILTHLVETSTMKSQEYAKMIFNYERRIALDVMSVLREPSGNASRPQIRTMQQLADEAPSLPILQTAQSMFKKKITENTQVLVNSPIVLRMISQIITTTDKEVLNNFVMWSVIRHFVPYMSRDFRVSMQQFEKVLYGVQSKEPVWHFCTKVVQQWMPYGLEVLRENPALIVHDRSEREYPEHQPVVDPYHSSQLVTDDQIRYDDELVKMMFYHIRDEYKSAIINANWVNEKLTKFVADKLSMMRVQIGIPGELLKSDKLINEFYTELVLDELVFVDNVISQWGFAKLTMDQMLDNRTESERIVSELYPPIPFGTRRAPVADLKYSIGLNMVIISREKTREPYFHYKYPISLNFARLGADISLVIHDAINTLTEQFKNTETNQPRHIVENVFDEEAQQCITRILPHSFHPTRISNESKLHLYLELSAASVLRQAFGTLLDKIDRNERIFESEISEKTTYEVLGLRHWRRQAGLRRYDQQQLFSLAYLQKHCAVPDSGAVRLTKLLLDNDIPETEKFHLLWRHVPSLAATLDCSSSSISRFSSSSSSSTSDTDGGNQNSPCSRIL
ncbi:protein gone early [Topomyia yanbarensis]|uniref:protein gone early n=1 Tax=Topomyia yanbarensis TaxID=2498891 RepID=UPI00273C09AB|nr:protein gone early [Topomyia yanbarensis]XP_058831518.1 protein gone early [Topomyia yanbarensis]XP_058831526.1 protein gone early [Topomyia yanbarensis]XP_058831535.1 protein gone early [Topomyia yanbarensis]XP_058831546.1 protein gone early [Topomyia yanbarensis]XP_058831555.1 protein gone early [Topomyia yanbarensis]XP_058831564.1 protein gone early [Topomyia yanbarensis]XP_058831573.1 protein gone early [Topomyia yanbarensis]XP_058831581.1 protein gone early [Topomyia yanbarensis]XP